AEHEEEPLGTRLLRDELELLAKLGERRSRYEPGRRRLWVVSLEHDPDDGVRELRAQGIDGIRAAAPRNRGRREKEEKRREPRSEEARSFAHSSASSGSPADGAGRDIDARIALACARATLAELPPGQ